MSASALQETLRAKMEYKKFQQLVRGGEKDNVDFKIQCDAFNSKLKQPKAELAKDICAMANNGYVASYIIVGVSDDGKGFQSVSNPKLTEKNVQSFCKTAIAPPPRVRVQSECWPKAFGKQKGKRFIIIQIGPHARQAFRLAKDFIAWDERICYRRNEVWIRRGTTSDLAEPEEIARLAKGQAPVERVKAYPNVKYLQLPKDEQTGAVLRDLETWVAEVGGLMQGDRLVVPIGQVRYVWRCVVSGERSKRNALWNDIRAQWEYEHGFVFLVQGSVHQTALDFVYHAPLHFKQTWGWFTLVTTPLFVGVPNNTKPFSLVLLTLPNIVDTDTLRRSLSAVLGFLGSDEVGSRRAGEGRDSLNDNLRRWRREGWQRRWGPVQKPPELMASAKTILDLSAGRMR